MRCEDCMFCRLGDLVTFTSGGTPSKSNPNYWNGNIPWISAKTMKMERVTTSDLFITEDGLRAGSRLAKQGSILILTRGSGLFNDIPICLAEKDLAFNQDIKCLNSCTSIDNKFIFYWLLSQKEYLSTKVGSTGIGAGKFDTDILMNLMVPIFSTEVRNRIVAIADSISEKIATNLAINENLERQAMALYRKMFVETNNDARRECRADEYFDISIGKTPPRKEAQWFSMNPIDCIWVSISDMGRCGMYIADSSEYLTHESVDKFNIKVVPDNTVRSPC